MKGKRFTEKQQRRFVAYDKQHGWRPTLDHFKISGSALLTARKRFANGAVAAVRNSTPPVTTRDAVVYLRKAWRLVEKDLAEGSKLRNSDLLLKLALNSLEGKED